MIAIKRWLQAAIPVEKSERPAVCWAFAWFFWLMCGYQILRPIREAFASEQSSGSKGWLFLATFIVSLLATPLYAWLVSRLTRGWFMHVVTHFLASNIVLFAVAIRIDDPDLRLWLGRVYFVWVTVFSLNITCMFWSVMADLFTLDQARRLFGPIASGATAGAIIGSLLAGHAASLLGLSTLVLASAFMLEIGLACAMRLPMANAPSSRPKTDTPSSGIWQGLVEIAKSAYLIRIAIYLGILSFCSTNIYMQLTDTAGLVIKDASLRTSFFASLNLYAQLGTLLAQSFVAGFIMRRFGLGTALMVLPTIFALSFISLGANHSLFLLGMADVCTRIGAYGITVPAREALFTVVNKEAKYKSKNFIDIVVFRGSDAMSSSLQIQMKHLLGSASVISWTMVPVTIAWMSVGYLLGRDQRRIAKSNEIQ